MEDVEANYPAGTECGGLIREANSTMHEEDDKLIYDQEHFWMNKA